MKSAYELAIERLGGDNIPTLTTEQKEQIAEIGRRFQAKMAEANLAGQARLKAAAGDAHAQEQIRQDLAVEMASLRNKEEREKEKIRTSTSTSS